MFITAFENTNRCDNGDAILIAKLVRVSNMFHKKG